MSGVDRSGSSKVTATRVGALLIALASVASCAGRSLTLDQWEAMWQEAVVTVDDATSQPVTEAVCEETLGYLREVRPDLDPPPLADLESAFDSWFAEAEDAFFECRFDDEATRERILQALNTFEAEVDTVLSLEG